MTVVTFDTHRYVKRLTAAGMPEPQAEAIADEQRLLIDEHLATKEDLRQLEERLDFKLVSLEQRLENKLTLRVGAMIAASVALMTALNKLL